MHTFHCFLVGLSTLTIVACGNDGIIDGSSETAADTDNTSESTDTSATTNTDPTLDTTTQTSGTTTESDTEADTDTVGPGESVVRAVYRQLVPNDYVDIYAVDIVDGVVGEPHKLNPDFGMGEGIPYLSLSFGTRTTDRWLAFKTESNENLRQLYLTNLQTPEPGMATRVTVDPVPELGLFRDYTIAPNDALLAFTHEASDGGSNIFLVPLDGEQPGATIRLHPEVEPENGVFLPTFSPDSAKIAYDGSFDNDLKNVFVQSVSNGDPEQPIRVSDNQNPEVSVGEVNWLADDWLMYRGDVDNDEVDEVFVVDVSTAPFTPIMLDPGDMGLVLRLTMAPDMRGCTFWAGGEDLLHGDIYYAAFDGESFAPPVIVNTHGAGLDSALQQEWSPDSNWLMYLAEDNTPGSYEVFAVDMSSGTPAPPHQVNSPMSSDPWTLPDVQYSPLGDYVYYTAYQDSESRELYRAKLSPGAIGASERTHAQTLSVVATEMDFKNNQLVFAAMEGPEQTRGIYAVDLNSLPLIAAPVNPPHPDTTVKHNFHQTKDGQVIVYATNSDEPFSVFLVDQERGGLGVATQITDNSYSVAGLDWLRRVP